ncbi:MAG: flagellar basal body FlgE domain-containing protein [Methylococcales bacterium]|nr:flagellar basal body FlgE domain-containing protein [Methylococcales bacterium]MDD5755313.1 flagellar basal body FlgE domain-containing protein [Methylococcales bacterium]
MTLPKKAIIPAAAMIAAVQPVNHAPKIVAPDAITNVEMTLNLNGSDKPVTKAFSFLKHTDDAAPYVPNPDTYTNVVSMNIADQNGNDHVFSTYFAKTAVANEWNAYVFIDGRNIDTVTNFPSVNNDSLPPLDLSALSKIDLPPIVDTNPPTLITLSSTDAVNFFPMAPLVYQGTEQVSETVNNDSLPPLDLATLSLDLSSVSGATGLYFPNEFSAASGALIFQGSAPAAEERSMYFSLSGGVISSVVLGEGEITANPLKISFDDKGQLVNVDDVDMVKGFRTKAPSSEELANYAITHEPISTTYEPFTTASVFFDHLDLSAINPDLKSVPLNIGVDFANSTQFATPFTVNDLKQTWGLTGTSENDTLSGSAGNDWIIGDMGVDKMTGGMGADQFSFHNVEETGLTAKTRDIITDFKHSDGDKIDLYDIDANSADVDSFGFQIDQSFTFIGAKAFSKTDATGQLRFDATTHILYGSTDADNKPEFSIQLNGVNSLVASDFVL